MKATFINNKIMLAVASQYKLYLPTEQQLLKQENKQLQNRNDKFEE